MSVYDFHANLGPGDKVDFKSYKGKCLLIVNTASKCGFTSQYKGLQDLYEKHQGSGLEILAFPCNQFGNQEPGSNDEIRSFCDLTYKTSFPLFEKVDVKGSNAHPLFKFLSESCPGLLGSKSIKWNFTKFLIDRDGTPLERFAPQDTPEKIEEKILEILK